MKQCGFSKASKLFMYPRTLTDTLFSTKPHPVSRMTRNSRLAVFRLSKNCKTKMLPNERSQNFQLVAKPTIKVLGNMNLIYLNTSSSQQSYLKTTVKGTTGIESERRLEVGNKALFGRGLLILFDILLWILKDG